MKFSRIISGAAYKGTQNYLTFQKKYEIIRTVLLFGVSISLFIAGWVTTKTKVNLLTIVAVLGCLPACKSLVTLIMFLRFQGCSKEHAEEIKTHSQGLIGLYDMVFTTYEKNYNIAHMTLRGNTGICFTEQVKFDETAFVKHLADTLALEGITGITFKVFTDRKKYLQRLSQLKELEEQENLTESVKATLLSIVL